MADDYLVSFQANRYSVPFRDRQKVDVVPVGALLRIEHAGQAVAEYPRLEGKHQMRILPEHGPGAAARNARQRYALAQPTAPRVSDAGEVEVRDLAVYEELAA